MEFRWSMWIGTLCLCDMLENHKGIVVKKREKPSVIGIKTWEYAKLISFSNKKSKGYFIDGTRGRRSGLSENILFFK